MNRRITLSCLLLILLLAVLGLLIARLWTKPEAPPPQPPPQQTTPAEVPPPQPGRDPEPPDPTLWRAALEIMGDAREGRCGPYRLATDVPGSALVEVCARVAEPLEATFRARFGLEPRGNPREGVLLFAERQDFQRFARRDGLRSGYAGYANGAEGFLALPAGGLEAESFAQTLGHELTHLLLRRAMGPGLPPWLSEGLADALGDTATPQGIGELVALQGVEGQARRLRDAYRHDLVPGLEHLTSLRRGDFDKGTRSYDYEQSALFVRYLLLDPELSTRFRGHLKAIAGQSIHDPRRLPKDLERSWEELDRDFRDWVLSSH